MGLTEIALKHVLKGTRYYEFASAFKARKRGYSQFGEDLHVASFYDRLAHDHGVVVNSGLIVDIGAFRPIIGSNTYQFYRRGWTTINIDPTPGSKSLFDAVRPRDINLQVAVGQNDGETTFYVFGEPSVWNTMSPDAASLAAEKTGINPREVLVQVRRLDSILRDHIGQLTFELLSIDAEGIDLEILQSNNFELYRPRVILIETMGISLHTIPSHPVTAFMGNAGYELYSWINPNLMFIRRDSVLMT